MFSRLTTLLSSASCYVRSSPGLTCNQSDSTQETIDFFHTLSKEHETAKLLRDLIEKDGAGSWPPKVSYGTEWPTELRPYHDACLKVAPLITTEDISLDDEVNRKRCSVYRTLMREVLADLVDLAAVEACLSAAEVNKSLLPPAAWNGFLGCLSVLRHCYRWALIPCVKVAQLETGVDFPLELQVPWTYMRTYYGIDSQGGSVMSNFICTTTESGEVVYPICGQRSEGIKKMEEHFDPIFRHTEDYGLSMYRSMVASITQFESGQREECIQSLKAVNKQLRPLLKVFYGDLRSDSVPYTEWTRYIQSLVSWGLGETGACGGQTPCFLFLDAFADICPHMSAESMLQTVPISQRNLRSSFRRHNFRRQAEKMGDAEITAEFEQIMKQMRVFRHAHRARVLPYFKVDAPERVPIFASRGVVKSDGLDAATLAFNLASESLSERIAATV